MIVIGNGKQPITTSKAKLKKVEIKTEKAVEKKSFFNWNTAPDVKKQENLNNIETIKKSSEIEKPLEIITLEETKKPIEYVKTEELKQEFRQEKKEISEDNFKIIEDQWEKGFKIKGSFEKQDDSILKIHQKNIADDLTKIEWIGPKIQELLNQKSLYTFADVAKTDAYQISDILALAGTRFQMHNPKTWPKQAEIASKWNWDELKKYQDVLKGGKE